MKWFSLNARRHHRHSMQKRKDSISQCLPTRVQPLVIDQHVLLSETRVALVTGKRLLSGVNPFRE